MLVGLFVFVLLLVVGIRKFFMNRRNLSRNIGAYRQFGTQPASHPSNHIIYQPNFNHNNPPNTYPNTSPASNPYQNQLNPNPNLTYPPQLPNAYFQCNDLRLLRKQGVYLYGITSQRNRSILEKSAHLRPLSIHDIWLCFICYLLTVLVMIFCH